MEFVLEPLPFEEDALEPFIGAETVAIHHEKHHGGYVKKLDAALDDPALRDASVTEVMLGSEGQVFNLAAKIWNHNFYWQSLTPEACSPERDGALSVLLKEAFDGMEGFTAAFAEVAANQFGSGWAWLVLDPEAQKLRVNSTSDADNPLMHGMIPLLTLDVWEHAYYLDFKNDRGAYIQAFLNGHASWRFAEENLTAAMTPREP
jgi:Fe-Mn family superoxide dismutase